MTTKDLDGFTVKRTGEKHPYYLRHQYLVDGYVHKDDNSFDDIATCKNKKEALQYVRRFRHMYERITIYDEWWEEDIDPRYGNPIIGDIVSQTVEDYMDGKPVRKERLL